LALAFAMAAPAGAQGRVFGVLAAASKAEDRSLPTLEGVANDIVAMNQAVLQRGAREGDVIRLLDDGQTPGYGAATRAAILAAIDVAMRRAGPGDQLVVYLTGHGGQVVDHSEPPEADGLDEVFLPASGEALNDDDIGAALDAVRARGVDVLFVADFCNAGDAVRGGTISRGPSVTYSSDPPYDAGHITRGRLVAIYSGPANRASLQSFGPVGAPEESQRVQSILTMYTASALMDREVTTYRELKNAIVAGIEAHGRAYAWLKPEIPNPQFEGSLDRLILTTGRETGLAGPFAFRKPFVGVSAAAMVLPFGALNGLADGELLSFSQAGSQDGAPRKLFFGRVVSTGPAHALIAPVLETGAPLSSWTGLTDRFGAPFDYTDILLARRERIDRASFDVGDTLQRLHARAQDAASARLGEALKVEFSVLHQTGSRASGTCAPVEPIAADGTLPPGASGWSKDAGSLTIVGCDVVFVRVSNKSESAVDLTLLVLEPNGQIEPLSTAPAVLGARAPAGASLVGAHAFDAAEKVLEARLAVIGAAVTGESDEIVSYSHLCTPAPGATTSCEGLPSDTLRGEPAGRPAEVSASVVLLRSLRVGADGIDRE